MYCIADLRRGPTIRTGLVHTPKLSGAIFFYHSSIGDVSSRIEGSVCHRGADPFWKLRVRVSTPQVRQQPTTRAAASVLPEQNSRAPELSTPQNFKMGNDIAKPFGEDAEKVVSKQTNAAELGTQTAIFAAGCFWGIELAFQRVPGVTRTQVGYINGHKENPTYEEVCSGETGHAEALRMEFDPNAISYEELLAVFWDRLDPTQLNAQGNDVGTQYRSGIYYLSLDQKSIAEASRDAEQSKYSEAIATEIQAAETFWPAEEYHQSYLAKGGQCAAKGDLTPIRCYG